MQNESTVNFHMNVNLSKDRLYQILRNASSIRLFYILATRKYRCAALRPNRNIKLLPLDFYPISNVLLLFPLIDEN